MPRHSEPGLSKGVVKNLGFLGFSKKTKNLKSPNFRVFKVFKQKRKNLYFRLAVTAENCCLCLISCVYGYAIVCTWLQMMWQGNRCIMYENEIFFVNFWVIILGLRTLKPKNLKKNLKTFLK